MNIAEARAALNQVGLSKAREVGFNPKDNNQLSFLCRIPPEGSCLHCKDNRNGGLFLENGHWVLHTKQDFQTCAECPRTRK
jgi:hypothetical protein